MDSAPLPQGVSTVVELLEKRAREEADRLAYCFLSRGEQELSKRTYGESKRAADGVACLLRDVGVAGERALLMYPPGLAFVDAFFGSLQAGTLAVPVQAPDRRGLARALPRLAAIAKDCGAKFLLTTTDLLGMKAFAELAPPLAELTWLATDGLEPAATPFSSSGIQGSSLAFLQYTSGSTAAPRGVMVSHSNLLHNCALVKRAFEQDEDSILVTWLPLHHDMGLIGCVLQPLYSGYPDYLMAPLDFIKHPVHWLKAISKYRATISGGPNFAYELCVRSVTDEQRAELDLSSWRIAFCGAEPVQAATLQRFAERFAACGFEARSLYPCYGLAEATLIVTGGPKATPPNVVWADEAALAEGRVQVLQDPERARPQVSCGPVDVGEVRIVDPERLTETSGVGEIWLAGPCVAAGYWNDAEASRAVFGARMADGRGPYLRTGDLGFVLDGELHVCGRIKDLIIAFGKNHHPQDIEQTVHEMLPELRVGGVVAFGVPKGDAEAAVIVIEAAAAALRSPSSGDVIERVRSAVMEEHQLAVHDVVLARPGAIHRTTSGKLARASCRREYLSGGLSP